MGSNYSNIFIYFFSGFILTYSFIYYFINTSRVLNLVDIPNHRKLHLDKIPSIGGVAIFFTISLMLILSYILGHNIIFVSTDLIFLIISTLIIFVLGFLDDRYKISVLYKLITQIIASFIIIFNIDYVKDFDWSFLFLLDVSNFSFIISLLFILIILNGTNFIDGLDGLLVSISILLTLYFLILFIDLGFLLQNLLLLIMILGALLAFFIFNKPPAKVFLGDSGSLIIGWFFSILSFYYMSHIKIDTYATLPIFALSIPILDLLYVVILRFHRTKGRMKDKLISIFKSDRKHLHYQILEYTHSVKKTIFVMCFINIIIISTTYYLINNY